MKSAIENYDNLTNIMKESYNVCAQSFDSEVQGVRLFNYFQQLIGEQWIIGKPSDLLY